jgi:hypothetical protein
VAIANDVLNRLFGELPPGISTPMPESILGLPSRWIFVGALDCSAHDEMRQTGLDIM